MIIKCRTCKKQKPETDFGFWGDKGLRRRYCEECKIYFKEHARKNREHILEVRRFRYHTDPTRSRAKYNAEDMRKKRADPKRKLQLYANHLKRKYGVTLEQYKIMLEAQNNCCAICEINFSGDGVGSKKIVPCLDHCHRTNKVRGLLCRKCNLAISYIESFKFYDKAQEYLRVNGAEDKEPLT